MLIRIPRRWELSERQATSEAIYLARREFLRGIGFGAALALTGCGLSVESDEPAADGLGGTAQLPSVTDNERYRVDERAVTSIDAATSYNNYWEFSESKQAVRSLVKDYPFEPWTLRVDGLVRRPLTLDLDDLRRGFQLEQRVYRFRCVEAWAMTVPWVGFALSELLARVEPLSEAKFLRFTTVEDRTGMPNISTRSSYPWPYREAIRLDEAQNELSLLTVGMYGRTLPGQNGAPVRLVLPWKYGYKSIKSVVRIELVAEQPATFWNSIWPEAYDFLSNVDPQTPHPGWSQQKERQLETGDILETRPFNGYAEFVAALYP